MWGPETKWALAGGGGEGSGAVCVGTSCKSVFLVCVVWLTDLKFHGSLTSEIPMLEKGPTGLQNGEEATEALEQANWLVEWKERLAPVLKGIVLVGV